MSLKSCDTSCAKRRSVVGGGEQLSPQDTHSVDVCDIFLLVTNPICTTMIPVEVMSGVPEMRGVAASQRQLISDEHIAVCCDSVG